MNKVNFKIIFHVILICFSLSCIEKKHDVDRKYIDERIKQDNKFYEHTLSKYGEEVLIESDRNSLRFIISYPKKHTGNLINMIEFNDFFLISEKEIREVRQPRFKGNGYAYGKEKRIREWEKIMDFMERDSFFSLPISDLYTEETIIMSHDNRWILEVKYNDKYNRISRNLDFNSDDIKYYKKVLDIFPDSLVSSFPVE